MVFERLLDGTSTGTGHGGMVRCTWCLCRLTDRRPLWIFDHNYGAWKGSGNVVLYGLYHFLYLNPFCYLPSFHNRRLDSIVCRQHSVRLSILHQQMSSNTLPPILSFSSNGGSFPPHGTITAIDHGPYVVVTTWILMCTTVLSATARLGIRMKTVSLFTVDNAVIVFGTVSGRSLRTRKSSHLTTIEWIRLFS